MLHQAPLSLIKSHTSRQILLIVLFIIFLLTAYFEFHGYQSNSLEVFDENYKDFETLERYEIALAKARNQTGLKCGQVARAQDVRKFPQTSTSRTVSHCDGPIIVQMKMGRLGNNICEFLSMKVLRSLFRVRVTMDDELYDIIDSLFKNTDVRRYDNHCPHVVKEINHMVLYRMLNRHLADPSDTSSSEVLENTTFNITSYPCYATQMMNHRKTVTKNLVLRKRIRRLAENRISNLLRKHNAVRDGKLLISVHVRRTDYATYMNTHFNRTLISVVYYHQAFHYMRLRFKNVLFIVASDDPNWCHRYLTASDVLILDDDPTMEPIVDMAVMILCDHHIFGLGTYGFIGAYMGSGIIIHPYVIGQQLAEMEDDLLCSRSSDLISIPDSTLRL